MAINRRSRGLRIFGVLAIALLAADIVAAAAFRPPAGASLWADLARLCSVPAMGDTRPATEPDQRPCVFCLPLMTGAFVAPVDIGVPAPLSVAALPATATGVAAPVLSLHRAHPARGPPTV